MKTRRLLILVLLACAVSLLLYIPAPAISAVKYKIVDPVYSVPMPVLAGSSFNAVVYTGGSEVTITGAWIVAPGLNYTLEIGGTKLEGANVVVKLTVPSDASPELYDLYIKAGEVLLRSPRSVWVLKGWPSELVFMQLTDIHIDLITSGVHSTTYYETAISILNTAPVMFAVITGDNVDVGSDVNSLKTYKAITNRARKPTFIVPGNHDHAQTDERSFRELFYGAYIGPAMWYRVIGKFLIVGLDSGLDGYFESAQLKWLEEVLSAHKDKVKILLFHHPLFNYATFKKITGSWKEIEKIPSLYSSWRDHLDSAKELLRLIEEYNVNLVLSGHVHGDAVVLYNGKTWFVTTTTTCAGIREGDYRGFRIIRINDKGEVLQVGVPGKDPFKGFSSYNIQNAKIIARADPEHKAYTIWAYINPAFELKLDKITLYFYVNASVPADQYKIYGDTDLVEEYKFLKYGEYYVVKVTAKAKIGEPFKLTVASYKDETPPEAQLLMYTPRIPISGKDQVTLYIKAFDVGYGIESVKVIYETPTGTREIKALHLKGTSYQVMIPPLRAREIRVKVVAVDLAGNVKESEEYIIEYRVPTVKIPKLSVSLDCKPEVKVGKVFKLTVTVKNVGNGTARAVKIEVKAPSGVKPTSAEYTIDALEPGKSVSKTFEFTALEAGTYELKVSVKAEKVKPVEEVAKVKVVKPPAPVMPMNVTLVVVISVVVGVAIAALILLLARKKTE